MVLNSVKFASLNDGQLRAILVGGIAAGFFDIVYACIVHGIAGTSPTLVLQSIASGLLGRSAFGGGTGTAAFGLLLHFLMTIIMAAIFVAASKRSPQLIERPVRWGLAYGLTIYVVMNYVVLPLSAFPGGGKPSSLLMLAGGLAIHAFGVGLPIALAGRHFTGAHRVR